MKVGDLIECNGDYRGVIMGITRLYPGHPDSPARHFEVLWLNEEPPYSFSSGGKFKMVSPFAVKRVGSHAK